MCDWCGAPCGQVCDDEPPTPTGAFIAGAATGGVIGLAGGPWWGAFGFLLGGLIGWLGHEGMARWLW